MEIHTFIYWVNVCGDCLRSRDRVGQSKGWRPTSRGGKNLGLWRHGWIADLIGPAENTDPRYLCCINYVPGTVLGLVNALENLVFLDKNTYPCGRYILTGQTVSQINK